MPIKSKILKLGRPIKALSGDKVFAQGKPARSLFYVSSGSLVTRIVPLYDRAALVVDVPSGHFVPVAALLAGATSYIVDGIAQMDCELVVIAVAKLRSLLLEDVSVSNFFLD